MAYTTLAAVKAQLKLTVTTNDNELEDIIEAAQAAVETFTSRVWEDPPEAARTFTPCGWDPVLDIDEATSINTVEERRGFGSWTAVSSDDWELFASGDYLDSLVRKTGAWALSSRGEPTVRVTAIWASTSTAPHDVSRATTILAARLFGRREAVLGVEGGGIDTVATQLARTDPDVHMLLRGKKRTVVG